MKERGNLEIIKIAKVTTTIAGNIRKSLTKEKAKINTMRPMNLYLGSQRCNGESR
jgi:hypothetical protein